MLHELTVSEVVAVAGGELSYAAIRQRLEEFSTVMQRGFEELSYTALWQSLGILVVSVYVGWQVWHMARYHAPSGNHGMKLNNLADKIKTE